MMSLMGTVRGREVRFRIYPKDHPPVHAHGKIGAGEVIVEVRRNGEVALSTVHKDPVVGNVKNSEISTVLAEAADFAKEIRAEWKEMQK
jgi:MoaA/NifB/PqqE/SkfB family radical SAM enzyme